MDNLFALPLGVVYDSRMKKYTLILLVLAFFISLFGINIGSIDAAGPYNEYTFGCTSTAGYSPTTGEKCNILVYASLPTGCTSVRGYSPLTGVKCDTVVDTSLPAGCTSTSGFSVTTGQRCSRGSNFPPGCSSYSGYSSTTGKSCSVSTSQAPVIYGVSGPQLLDVNEQGAWEVNASDSRGDLSRGNLSYSVVWGDENNGVDTAQQSRERTTTIQRAAFTHIYDRAGTYTPTFTVTNNLGQSAQTSLSVKVGDVIDSSGNLKITTDSLPTATIGSSYEATISASGGTGDYRWSISSGSLPAGLYFYQSECGVYPCARTAYISGTPSASASFSSFTVTLKSGIYSTSKTFTINVSSGTSTSINPTISSLSQYSGPVGTKVVIYGSGFATGPQATTNSITVKVREDNKINFSSYPVVSVTSLDGTSLTFSVPTQSTPICDEDMCNSLRIEPGTYPITITNANGTSNQVSFTVISSTSSTTVFDTSTTITPMDTRGCPTTKSGGYSVTTGKPC